MKKLKIRTKRRIKRTTLTVILGAFALMFLLPIVFTLASSFMSATEISANYGVVLGSARDGDYMSERVLLRFIPTMVTAWQYVTVLFLTPEYLERFLFSILLVVPIVFVQVFIATGAAYSFARFRTKRKEILFFAYVVLMLMPFQVTLVPNFMMARWMGTIDTWWAIYLPGFFAPFSVFLLTKFMRRIPIPYVEAAKLDGANEWQIFTRIFLPLCKGAIFAVVILVFIDYWNMVEQPLIMLSDPDTHPLSVFLARVNAEEIGIAFAVSVLYLLPPLLLFLRGEQYLVEGITHAGGVK